MDQERNPNKNAELSMAVASVSSVHSASVSSVLIFGLQSQV